MAEVSQVTAEITPSSEGSASREQVINAFNSAASRWKIKADHLHSSINGHLEMDDLADTDLLTQEQRDQLGSYRSFQKGTRRLTGSDYVSLSRLLFPGGKDTITTSFATSDEPEEPSKIYIANKGGYVVRERSLVQEPYTREEGLDVSGLIKSAREDVENTRTKLEADRNSKYPLDTGLVEYLQDRLSEEESQLRTLEENSAPYAEAFPNALNESDPVEKARIAEETKRVRENPLTSTGSVERDRQVAIERLKQSRLLKIPEKVTVHEPQPWTAEDYVRDQAEVASPNAAAVIETIRDIARTDKTGEFEMTPETARKVSRLMRIRIPEFNKRNLRTLLLPLVVALLVLIPRGSSIGVEALDRRNSQPPIATVVTTSEVNSSGAVPSSARILEARDLYETQEPNNLDAFREFGGWKNSEFRDIDYTIRDDYKTKIGDTTRLWTSEMDQLEGYSLKGLTESMIAELVNPHLAQRVEQLHAEGKNLPETDYELNRTLDLLKDKTDPSRRGIYKNMIADFTRRMGRLIPRANGGYNEITQLGEDGGYYNIPILWHNDRDPFSYEPKIVVGKFKAWVPKDRDMDTWYRLNFGNPTQWHAIRDEINEQLAQEGVVYNE